MKFEFESLIYSVLALTVAALILALAYHIAFT